MLLNRDHSRGYFHPLLKTGSTRGKIISTLGTLWGSYSTGSLADMIQGPNSSSWVVEVVPSETLSGYKAVASGSSDSQTYMTAKTEALWQKKGSAREAR